MSENGSVRFLDSLESFLAVFLLVSESTRQYMEVEALHVDRGNLYISLRLVTLPLHRIVRP